MLEKIGAFMSEMSQSPDFTYSHKQGQPGDKAAIKRLVDLFKALGYETPSSLVRFYEAHDGFTLRWSYKKSTHPDYMTGGQTDISDINMLITWLQHVPNDLIPFDYMSDVNQVLLHLQKKKIVLVYRNIERDKTFPMSIDINEYFHLLDESRGLYPWRELFIKSRSFKLKPVLKDKFFNDLKLLFKDANPTLFIKNKV
jgi:hypothetical protein